jgi:hypothetical protein
MNLALVLFCIAAVESGNDPAAVSRTGDTGACQMSAVARSEDPSPEARLERLARELPRHGMPVNAYTLALAWCAPSRAFRARPSDRDAGYARRVRDLYLSLQ